MLENFPVDCSNLASSDILTFVILFLLVVAWVVNVYADDIGSTQLFNVVMKILIFDRLSKSLVQRSDWPCMLGNFLLWIRPLLSFKSRL
jgi:hypothetical protein